ncbi:MacB-like periplasmic core domain protein [uncultured archaeon]|nr:MacB-like periplasmic core domain protein [uncultured archaeon]
MGFGDFLQYAINNLRYRQLRSWLTVVGIVIGIGSIVTLISLTQGLSKGINDQLASVGTNYVVILPGNTFTFKLGPPSFRGVLTTSDVNAIKGLAGVDGVSELLTYNALVSYKKENVTQAIAGIRPSVITKLEDDMEEGSYITDGDLGSVVLGYNVAHTVFSERIRTNQVIFIDRHPFKVKGIFKKFGNLGNRDDSIFADPQAVRNLLGPTYDKNRVFAIEVVTKKTADPDAVAALITQTLRNKKHEAIGKEDFSAISASSLQQQIGQITSLLSLFLGGVAAISLIVGAIGIANAMFTSVLERTREIGILKSIGAKGKEILLIFLLEAGLIGLFGGIIGILGGVGIALLLSAFGVPIVLSYQVLLFALFFSVVIGVISGYFPARSASKLLPVEALRYE